MAKLIIGIMIIFMVLGAVDRALLKDRLALGPELEKGLNTIGPLLLAMGGIMCAAPVLGSILGIVITPVFRLLGCDPAIFGGMFFASDMGGYALTASMTANPDVHLLSGVLLGTVQGFIVSFTIPVGLILVKGPHQKAAAKGLVISMICAPTCAVFGGMAAGLSLLHILRTIYPSVILALTAAFFLSFFSAATLRFFLAFSRALSAFCVLALAAAILDDLLGITLVPGMAPLHEQFIIVGEIGVTLAGAYPLIAFLKKHMAPFLSLAGRKTGLGEASILGILANFANPMPMFALTPEMSLRGTVVAWAVGTSAGAVFGDYLGFITAVAPQYTLPMVVGKLCCAAFSLALALFMTRHDSTLCP